MMFIRNSLFLTRRTSTLFFRKQGFIHKPRTSLLASSRYFSSKKLEKHKPTTIRNLKPSQAVRDSGQIEVKLKGKKRSQGYGEPGKFVLALKDITKTLPDGTTLFKDLNLQFLKGAKIGILGTNGSGKSTLMKIIAGIDDDFDGDVVHLADIKIGYLPQEPKLDESLDVKSNVLLGVQEKTDILNRYLDLEQELKNSPENTELVQQFSSLEKIVKEQKLLDLSRRIDRAIDALRCPMDTPTPLLSGGEKRRVALCRLLVSSPDVLLLDEPTNHLDAESVAWLERFLQDYRGMVMAITHDRYFLDNVAGWILEIDRGDVYGFEGNYSEWLFSKQKRLAMEAKQDKARQKFLDREIDWIRQNPKGRQAKSKARIKQYEEIYNQSRKRIPEPGTIVIPPAPRLGDRTIEAKSLSKSFGDRILFSDLSFTLPPAAIVGVVGPNGSGKSTLFRIITGEESPDSGSIRISPSVQLGFVSQTRDELNPDRSVWEEISGGQDYIAFGSYNYPLRAYVAAFNFKGTSQNKLVGDLSGGERNRVHLAKMLKSGANVLLLDEPSNDLDVDVLRNLEEAILEFSGCVVVVSHDRWFLDRICSHIIAFEGDSNVVFFHGNYSEYEEDRFVRLGSKFDPKRIRFKKIGQI